MSHHVNMTRRAVLATGLATSTLALAGCVSSGGGGSQAGTGAQETPTNGEVSGKVQFWTINLRKNFQDYFDALIADFEKQHPKVKIDWVDVPGKSMATKYLAALSTGAVPDAVNVDSKNLGALATTFTDLGPLLSKDDLSAYQEGLLSAQKVNGTLYGVPWYNSGVLIGIYRKSIVDKVGFDPSKPPGTWQEVLELADKVHKATGVYGTNTAPTLRRLKCMGVQFVNQDLTKATFATEQVAGYVKLFQKSYAGHGIAPDSSAPQGDWTTKVDNGKVAFAADAGTGKVTSLKKSAPDAYNDIYITTAPRNPDGQYEVPGQMGMSIPAKSKNKVAAAAFVKYVTSPEAQLKFCKLVPIFPSTSKTLKDPLFTDTSGKTPADQARQIVVKSFSNAVDATVPLPEGVPDQVRQDFIAATKQVMRSGKDPMPVLTAQQKIWQSKLDAAS